MDKKPIFTIDGDLLSQFLNNKNDGGMHNGSGNLYDEDHFKDDYQGYLIPNAQFYAIPEFVM